MMLRVLVFILIALIGVVSMIVNAFRFILISRRKKRYSQASAVITAFRHEGKKDYATYEVSVDGSSYKKEFQCYNVKKLSVGQQMPVYYNPADPAGFFPDAERQKYLLGIALPACYLAVMAVMIAISMPKEVNKVKGGGPATEYTCTQKETAADMLQTEISVDLKGSLIYSDTDISQYKDEEYSYLDTESGQVQYIRYYGQSYTYEGSGKYFKWVTYVAYPASTDDQPTAVLTFLRAQGSYEIADVENILQEKYSEENIREVKTETPEEAETELRIPDELKGIGADTVDMDSDKYIFLTDDIDSTANDVAVLPYREWFGSDAEIRYISWENNCLCYYLKKGEDEISLSYCYCIEGLVGFEKFNLPYKYEDKIIQLKAGTVGTASEDDNTYLWSRQEGYAFTISITGIADEQLIRTIYDSITFCQDDFDSIEAAGPQARRHIRLEAGGKTIDVWHTAGKNGLWYPDYLEELGIQDNYKVEMGITSDEDAAAASLNVLTEELYSGSGSLEIDGRTIDYAWMGGIRPPTVGSGSEKTYECDTFLDLGSAYLTCTIEATGITHMDQAELEDLIRKCYEGCLEE